MKKLASCVEDKGSSFEYANKQSVTKAVNVGPWSMKEHKAFLRGIKMYGNLWQEVKQLVKTRTCTQIRSHCEQYFRHLRKLLRQKLIHSSSREESSVTSHHEPYVDLPSPQESGIAEVNSEQEEMGDLTSEVLSEFIQEKQESLEENKYSYFNRSNTIISLENYYIKEYLKGYLSLFGEHGSN